LTDSLNLAVAVQSWIENNDPELTRALAGLEAGVGSEAKPVIQGTVLLGSERDAVLRDSYELRSSLQTSSGFGFERFQRNPMDGCTSVMNLAREGSGFNPAKVAEPGQAALLNYRNRLAYDDYIHRLRSAPFYTTALDDEKSVSRQNGNWDGLIADLVGLFEGISPQDLAGLRTGLIKLATVSASHHGVAQSQDVFAQSVLGAYREQNYTVHLYRSLVTMVSNSNKGATSTQTDFVIRRTKLIFRTADWPGLAHQVWAKKVTTVVDWLEANDTSSGNVRPNLCLKP
jgi:hypothetical protein